MPLLQFVALARCSDTLNWHAAGAWFHVAFLASILLLGAFGIRRCWFAREERAPLAAAASH